MGIKKIYKVTNLKVHSKGRFFFFLSLFKNYNEWLIWTTALFSRFCDITKWPFRISFKYSHITLQPKTGCPLNLSRDEPGQYLDGRPPGKTRLLLEEVLVRPAGGAHPVVSVGPNAPV